MAVLNEEQSMLRDAAKSWVQEKSPVTAFRKMRDSGVEIGFDKAAWAEQAEMGWAGVIIPEDFGGSNFGYLSLGLILEEMGRTLTASPLLASGLAGASALILGGSDAQKGEWLPKIAEGAVVATLAVDEGAHHAPEKVALKAEKAGSGYKLTGKKTFVLEGPAADLLIVSARTSGKPGDTDGISLFLVKADDAGVKKQTLKLADSRGASNIEFNGAAGELLGEEGKGWPVLEATLDRARAGVCAEMLGAAVQAFETTLDYLKVRVQFGQVIGSFQALQHRAAALYCDIELSRAMVLRALQALDRGESRAASLVSAAKAHASTTATRAVQEGVQMHGGMGMTDAFDMGLFMKRARTLVELFGDANFHADRFARLGGY